MANLTVGGRLSDLNKAKGLASESFPAQFAPEWVRRMGQGLPLRRRSRYRARWHAI